ncbi:MAG: hypothetical protein Q7T34_01465, partial [Candidatus Parcubacteria bacterium]|nr:hypothetical protein [Candidatus Parcubacteria bacterium]
MNNGEKIVQMAHNEIEWWKAHHRKDRGKLIEEMTRLHILLFNMTYEDAKKVVLYRIEAAGSHDEAEEYENQGNQNKADIHWAKAEESLQIYFA